MMKFYRLDHPCYGLLKGLPRVRHAMGNLASAGFSRVLSYAANVVIPSRLFNRAFLRAD